MKCKKMELADATLTCARVTYPWITACTATAGLFFGQAKDERCYQKTANLSCKYEDNCDIKRMVSRCMRSYIILVLLLTDVPAGTSPREWAQTQGPPAPLPRGVPSLAPADGGTGLDPGEQQQPNQRPRPDRVTTARRGTLGKERTRGSYRLVRWALNDRGHNQKMAKMNAVGHRFSFSMEEVHPAGSTADRGNGEAALLGERRAAVKTESCPS